MEGVEGVGGRMQRMKEMERMERVGHHDLVGPLPDLSGGPVGDARKGPLLLRFCREEKKRLNRATPSVRFSAGNNAVPRKILGTGFPYEAGSRRLVARDCVGARPQGARADLTL